MEPNFVVSILAQLQLSEHKPRAPNTTALSLPVFPRERRTVIRCWHTQSRRVHDKEARDLYRSNLFCTKEDSRNSSPLPRKKLLETLVVAPVFTSLHTRRKETKRRTINNFLVLQSLPNRCRIVVNPFKLLRRHSSPN